MRVETSSTWLPASFSADPAFAGKRVVVMGLGRFGGGVGVTRWLVANGARVLVTDVGSPGDLKQSVDALADCAVEFRLGGHETRDLEGADLLVVSPAVAKDKSVFFQHACRLSISWTTEINLFVERCPARIVGVTGTVGKSTAAAMIHAILNSSRGPGRCWLGGNIGGSLLDNLSCMTPDDVVVLELSSFQLSDLPLIRRRPDWVVIMPIRPNHLDRHGTFENYLSAKMNIVRGSHPGMRVVLADDDARLATAVAEAAPGAVVQTVGALGDSIVALRIPGRHNMHNARVAAVTAALAGADDEAVRAGLSGFRGLPHRLQFVGKFDGIDYYNDSKATSPEATITALRSFDRPVVLLAGGKASDAPIGELASVIAATAKGVVTFGQVGGALLETMHRDKVGDLALNARCVETLAQAVDVAWEMAKPGDVVLLSPGFSSYDAFANYEQRGDAFVARVCER